MPRASKVPMRCHVPCSLLAGLALSLSACVSDAPAVREMGETTETTAGSGAAEFGRVLQTIDKHVDEFVYYKSRPGDDAFKERKLRASALEALVAQHQERLLEAAQDATDRTRRRAATKALGFSTDSRAVDVLGEMLDPRADPRLITNATFALARIQSPQTPTQALLDLCAHADADVRNNSLLTLWHVMDARRRLGGEPLPAAQHQQALPLLEAAAFDPDDAFIRGHAAASLGALGDPRAVDPLINLLRDTHPFVRTHTANALRKLGDMKAIPALVAVIDESPRGTTRGAVVASLTVLVDRSGRRVPDNLADTERAWTQFLRARLGPAIEDPPEPKPEPEPAPADDPDAGETDPDGGTAEK